MNPAPEWSALRWRGEIICFAKVDGDWQARILGHHELLPITDGLRAAIEVEEYRLMRKGSRRDHD